MGSLLNGVKPPKVEPLPPETPAEIAPSSANADVKRAKDEERRRAAAMGRNSTVLTSSSGLANTAVATTRKTLLGS